MQRRVFHRFIEWSLLVTVWLMPFAGRAQSPLAEAALEVEKSIKAGDTPGAVFWTGQKQQGTEKHFVLGHQAVVPTQEVMKLDTVFDLASLTKVVATTSCIMKLVEDRQIKLDAPVATYLPEFTGQGREHITVRHLLTHTSALPAGIPRYPAWIGYETGVALACATVPEMAPGGMLRYSDTNYILLGEIVRRVSGENLNAYAQKNFFIPLGMTSTTFAPPSSWQSRIAPTGEDEFGAKLRGIVHDPIADRMGGIAGHAGLFATAGDLARFARMMLGEGELDGVRVLKPETVRLMTSVQTPASLQPRRGLGWDMDSPYSRPRGEVYPLGSYGHTGFTGTSIWIDPFSQSYVIVLTTRLHPDNKGSVIPLQARLATLAAQAFSEVDFKKATLAFSPRTDGEVPTVLNGIDALSRRQFAALSGLRVGLVTNHTGIDKARSASIDLLAKAKEVKLVALFSPEHGIRGEQDQSKIADTKDERTGLPVYSLYGESRSPSAAQLANLDALVFDIQDIGCRFYTYISTMQLCLEAAGKAGKKVFVLDRVNPIDGLTLEGPAVVSKESFVGCHPIPLRHGMTVGELAQMMNAERGYQCDLTVIPAEGWRRSMGLDETGLPWLNPSPNMRTLNAAYLYPGVGLLESAISVGRGTDTPFELVGAPYVNDVTLAYELNRAGLAGVRFVPERFTPGASTFKGKTCGGVRIQIVDRAQLRSLDIGMALASTLQRLYPKDFNLKAMDNLLLHPETAQRIKAARPWREIVRGWRSELEAFRERRKPYLIYDRYEP